MENHHKSWYAVITAEILYNKELTDKQKILMAVISNLSNEQGYCFATNKFLGNLLNCDALTVSRNLSFLEEKKYINRVMVLNEDGSLKYRALTVLPPELKNQGGYDETYRGVVDFVNTPIGANVNHNNIYTNNKYKNKKKGIDFLQLHGNTKTFEKPTEADVQQYCMEKKLNVDAATFVNFYESKGWFVGKNKMKDWMAACRTWHLKAKNSHPQNFSQKPSPNPDPLNTW